MIAFLNSCKHDPAFLFGSIVKSAFDSTMIRSQSWGTVHDFVQLSGLSLMSRANYFVEREAITVAERHLCDFLAGGKYDNVDYTVRKVIAHCPLNNLVGESSCGDFDFDLSKRRYAHLHNRSASAYDKE
ncbi:hypothetical protein RRG08_058385 [Elysia crispata]|uniref:Uncharacterized protein n=1 Tax=Elysia crispata TaxID=231223 RepID=A0AAE1CNL6_9GAST|nr:hypothetical protein RRG08_058385 [Elysia crispata]